jgi:cysteinyl-tRNA synthetase
LIEKFKLSQSTLDQSLINILFDAWKEFVQSKFLKSKTMQTKGISIDKIATDFDSFALVVTELDGPLKEDIGEKFTLYWNTVITMREALIKAREQLAAKKVDTKDCLDDLFSASEEVLADFLDKRQFQEVQDKSIFQKLSMRWEQEFFNDMQRLNVRPPDVLTRVSEYVPEIVEYIKTLVGKGLAYESNGSVYFDLNEFRKTHNYAKLCPWAAGHSKLIAEGEGSLGASLTGKKNDGDFALWKAAKPGEPVWSSPWGNGRPGWHIECSVMAHEICNSSVLDIHSGGIDLCFPHHDNEIAQSEVTFQQNLNFRPIMEINNG